jgi:hypothetical protein
MRYLFMVFYSSRELLLSRTGGGYLRDPEWKRGIAARAEASVLQDSGEHSHNKLCLAMSVGLHENALEMSSGCMGANEELSGSILNRLTL